MTTQQRGPRDLPDLRLRMAEFWDNPSNHPWANMVIKNPRDRREPLPRDVQSGFAELIRASLADGELYYIGRELVEIMVDGELPVSEYGFMPWDLPSPSGFMYFDGGMRFTDNVPRSFVLSWHTLPALDDDSPHGVLEMYVHAPKDEARNEFYPQGSNGSRFDQEQADFVLIDRINVPFAETGNGVTVRTNHRELGTYITSLLLSTCHLMRQTLAETTHETPDRGARRRHQRAGLNPPEIRVVRLRASERRESTGESARDWRHRWTVRGHWRRQWYPSIQAHRPVWIAPFVKGPEGAPLLGGDKVYVVRED